jgi:hypothetical protein
MPEVEAIDGGYFKAPNWVAEKAVPMIPTAGSIKVYLALWRFARDRVAWPSLARLAEMCRLNRSSVCRAVAMLAELRLITILEVGDRTTHSTSRYRLNDLPSGQDAGAVAQEKASGGDVYLVAQTQQPTRSDATDLAVHTQQPVTSDATDLLHTEQQPGGADASRLVAQTQQPSGADAPLQEPETITKDKNQLTTPPPPPRVNGFHGSVHADAGNDPFALNRHAPRFTEADVKRIAAAYPRQTAIGGALRNIRQAILRVSQQENPPSDPVAWLLARTQLFASSPGGKLGHYTPYASTWFEKEQYNDDPKEWQHTRDAGNSRSDRRRREHAETLQLPDLNVDDL